MRSNTDRSGGLLAQLIGSRGSRTGPAGHGGGGEWPPTPREDPFHHLPVVWRWPAPIYLEPLFFADGVGGIGGGRRPDGLGKKQPRPGGGGDDLPCIPYNPCTATEYGRDTCGALVPCSAPGYVEHPDVSAQQLAKGECAPCCKVGVPCDEPGACPCPDGQPCVDGCCGVAKPCPLLEHGLDACGKYGPCGLPNWIPAPGAPPKSEMPLGACYPCCEKRTLAHPCDDQDACPCPEGLSCWEVPYNSVLPPPDGSAPSMDAMAYVCDSTSRSCSDGEHWMVHGKPCNACAAKPDRWAYTGLAAGALSLHDKRSCSPCPAGTFPGKPYDDPVTGKKMADCVSYTECAGECGVMHPRLDEADKAWVKGLFDDGVMAENKALPPPSKAHSEELQSCDVWGCGATTTLTVCPSGFVSEKPNAAPPSPDCVQWLKVGKG